MATADAGPSRQAGRLDEPRALPDRPGLRLRELIGPQDGEHGLFLLELAMEPGAEIPPHSHTVTESVVVLEGVLSLQAGEEHIRVEAGHSFTVPAGTRHTVANRGTSTTRFLATAPWDQATFFTEATTYHEGHAPTVEESAS
jgi:quercetin dioxygenase-like cupin family protein